MLDLAANEPLADAVGDAVFPSSLARVTHCDRLARRERRALLTAGQARDPQADGTVTQRLFTHIGGVVEYADDRRHRLHRAVHRDDQGEIVGTTAGFTVVTDGTARRVFVLYKTQGDERRVEGRRPRADEPARRNEPLVGRRPDHRRRGRVLRPGVDASGNVAMSNNKVANFLASRLPSNGLAITVVPPAGVTAVNGWFSTTSPSRRS